ncbi:hypothetical protein ACH5RR_032478 [Cinchona calisaya]|uniref:Reverse transcriptase zinc-binding domain-containing protein n=1 Tax=Cinchona calisaya TaxID=153742 RepID=A0ABD2YI83_9GENT
MEKKWVKGKREGRRQMGKSGNGRGELGVNDIWGLIWKLDIPPKVKIFPCRGCRYALQTKVNLRARGFQLEMGCPVCGRDGEVALKYICEETEVEQDILSFIHGEVGLKCREILINTRMELKERFAMLVWGIWGLCKTIHHPQSCDWQISLNGAVEINFDAAVFRESSGCGIGALARDGAGCFMAGIAERVHAVINLEVVELIAAR